MKLRSDAKCAIAYLRVSTKEQHLGLEAQKAAILAWAERNGVTVVGWHEDRVSGTSSLEDRPGLLAALAALRSASAGVLVLQKRDRLARDSVEAGLIERAVKRLGASVCTADGSSDAPTATTALINGILDSVAQFEGAQIRARIKAALDAKRARGERVGTTPYGFMSAEGKLVPCEDEQATIATARALRTGGATLRGIVAALAARGAVSRVGKPFALTQVVNMLAA